MSGEIPGVFGIKAVDVHVCATCDKLIKSALDKPEYFGKGMEKLGVHVYAKHREDLATQLSYKMLEAYNEKFAKMERVQITLEEQ